jgi:hypothetical protein
MTLVSERKNLARKKSYDQLFSSTLHNSIQYFPAWIQNVNKDSVHPDISSATEKRVGEIKEIEFKMGGKLYKIISKESRDIHFDVNYEHELYLNEKKVFAISEWVDYGEDEWPSTTYKPYDITAFADDEWVGDFNAITDHQEQRRQELIIERAVDPEKIKKAKLNFGIVD